MSPLDFDTVRALRNIYAAIPDLHCKGLCASSCRTRIDMSEAELERIQRFTGTTLPTWMSQVDGEQCPLLEHDRCSVYGLRPVICRLWGAAESMPCPHGCAPDDGKLLSDGEAMDLMLRALEAGGARSGDLVRSRVLLREMPELKPVLARIMRGDASARAEGARMVSERFPDGVKPEGS